MERVTGINSDVQRMAEDIRDIKSEIYKRVPRWVLLVVTILSSVCTGLIVRNFGG